ncbi:putative type-B carboxylesterase lipase family protein [Lyophyllum shimeji]|uniref:Carboxylic ester hydrolase n=1 Tax=Lyophyllum shimeji TaxID=47721 RepID=A0A9P3PMD2_LYOSH|nr:putative type-B carboxylesterase lipase family protein [Lyophyllum shimeji]
MLLVTSLRPSASVARAAFCVCVAMRYLPLLVLTGWATAVTGAILAAPTVQLDSATVTGTTSGSSSKFLGIPFAKPPVGDLRFRLPQPIPAYATNFNATSFGLSCPQQSVSLPIVSGLAADAVNFIVNSIYGAIFPDSEDCLTINVVKRASATPSSGLPVVVWIYGGGFELGGTSMYDGGVIVDRSVALGSPVIYVSMNYRVSAFGFLASKEVRAAGAGNLGLQDQREALRWVQKYIGAFGGDPSKVTIWGESAGAISVSLHMIANNGDNEGLFRAGFMQSGSPIPVGAIENGQKYYDALVSQTGCAGASDTLACLRTVPYATLKAAMNKSPNIFSYQSLSLAWVPRADGTFLTDNPQRLVQQGKVANIPFITGDCDDEGTLFSLSTLNITTEAQLKTYIQTVYLPGISAAEVDKLATLYPADITQGSPYDTGILNALTPQSKRIASFQGDGVFQAPRRFFLSQRSGQQNTWAFLSKRLKALPVLGSAHGSDILNVYGGGGMADYLIRFATNLDPNDNTGLQWPKYTVSNPKLLTFLDGLIPVTITDDTYRAEAMAYLTNVTLAHPL